MTFSPAGQKLLGFRLGSPLWGKTLSSLEDLEYISSSEHKFIIKSDPGGTMPAQLSNGFFID